MNKRPSIALQFLENKTLTANQSGSDFPIESDRYFSPKGCTKKAVFLHDQFIARHRCQIDRDYGSWIGSGESDFGFSTTTICKMRHEQRLAGKDPRSCRQEFIEQSLRRV